MSNPFKMIEPKESVPQNVKGEVMGSIASIVMLLRFVQLFAADTTAVALTQMKIDIDKTDESSSSD